MNVTQSVVQPPSHPDRSRPAESVLPPASALLEAELKRVIKERGLVVWLDADDSYSGYVQGLRARAAQGAFPFPVLQYEGSFLQLMLELENYGNGLDPEKVLIHMPGFNTESITETPLYELYEAGKSYKKSLDTLIEEACVGLVRPEANKEFRAGKPSLADADQFFARAQLGEKDLFLIALEAYRPEAVLSELLSTDSKLNRDLLEGNNIEQFLEYQHKTLGLPADWPSFLKVEQRETPRVQPRDVKLVVASWLMAVEFVADLREAPISATLLRCKDLDKTLISTCKSLVEWMRSQAADAYRDLSGQFENDLAEDKGKHDASALGTIDTFRFEEETVREAALTAIRNADFDTAEKFAVERHAEACFWVRHDKRREHTWELIRRSATVGRELALADKGLKGCASLEEATQRYRDKLYRVDRAHRVFEQRFHHLLLSELADEADLREARNVVREHYRKWADQLAEEFATLCDTFGPLPSADMRQRAVYDHFVHARIEQGERVAYFMIDAMRFEMAEDLRQFFEGKKYRTVLNARLAELPTVTEVGMNALAPVVTHGKLRPVIQDRAFKGFRGGANFIVATPDKRVQAMASRSTGGQAINVELSEISDASASEVKNILRRQGSSPLIVVRSLELDSAGEKGFHLGTFERTLIQIREAVQRLQQAGIAHFVLAADHGFLLQDQTTRNEEYKDKPQRRHVLSPGRAGVPESLEIPLSALDYEVEKEAYLVFRRDTAVWKVKEKVAPFVHGGNSLQERVIPVLTLEKTAKSGASTAQYEVVATALPAQGRRESLQLKVRLQKQSNGTLGFASPTKISLALRVIGQDGSPLDALLQVVEVTPPGQLESGAVMVPPGADSSTVVFTIEGEFDEKVRVEVYHPDAIEKVTSTIVDGWFSMHRPQRLGRVKPGDAPPSSRKAHAETQDDAGMVMQAQAAAGADWTEGIEDRAYRQVFSLIDTQGSIVEVDLIRILGNARRMRTFSLNFDQLKLKIPFEVEVTTLKGMKVYKKGDQK